MEDAEEGCVQRKKTIELILKRRQREVSREVPREALIDKLR